MKKMKWIIAGVLLAALLAAAGAALATTAYESWSDSHGLARGPYDDEDLDGVNNLAEYGLGGDPTNAVLTGHKPVAMPASGEFLYVHPMLTDTNSALRYSIVTTDDLLSNVWTTATYDVLGTNTQGYAVDFDAVTNRVPSDDNQGFFRLAIHDEEQPFPVDEYIVPASGHYKVSSAWIERAVASGAGFDFGIMREDGWVLYRSAAPGDSRHSFDCYAGWFEAGDKIVLGAGADGESFAWDWSLEPYEPSVFNSFADAAGTNVPPDGWSFKWNAPVGWDIGVTGNLASAEIDEVSLWRNLVWSGSKWTADGDGEANNPPSDYLQLTGAGGHPGAAGATPELDRYAISVFRVGEPGDYQIGGGWIEGNSAGGNGVLVKIYAAGRLVKTVEAPAQTLSRFEARLEGLKLNDEIAVAVGANGAPNKDTFGMDFTIALATPRFNGRPVFDVHSFGAIGDGVTDDRSAIRLAVSKAMLAGGGVVRFDGGKTYRVVGLTDDTNEYLFNIENTANIKLEGNGAKLLLHPPDRLANIDASENIQVDGFTVNFDPLPYYQGFITGIDPAGLTMDILVPERYPVPALQSAPPHSKFFGRTFVPDAPGLRSGGGRHIYVDATSDIDGNNRHIRIHARDDMGSALQASLNEGATEFICPDADYGQRGQWVSSVTRSARVTYSNIRFYRILRQGLRPQRNHGPITYSNVDFWMPDETEDPVFHRGNELFISWRGHYLASNNRFGFLVEDGDSDGGAMYDDLYNAHAHTAQVVANNGLQATLHDDFFSEHWRPGDWISIWEGEEETLRGSARIVSIIDSGSTSLLVYDRVISGVSTNDSVINEEVQNRGSLWRDCFNSPVGSGRASLRVRTPVRFERCHFDNSYFWIYRNAYWEGPRPRDIVFDDCYIHERGNVEPMDIVKVLDLTMQNCTIENGRLNIVDSPSNVLLRNMEWINQEPGVVAVKLRDGTTAHLTGESVVNGTTNFAGWVDVDATSTIHYMEP